MGYWELDARSGAERAGQPAASPSTQAPNPMPEGSEKVVEISSPKRKRAKVHHSNTDKQYPKQGSPRLASPVNNTDK